MATQHLRSNGAAESRSAIPHWSLGASIAHRGLASEGRFTCIPNPTSGGDGDSAWEESNEAAPVAAGGRQLSGRGAACVRRPNRDQSRNGGVGVAIQRLGSAVRLRALRKR